MVLATYYELLKEYIGFKTIQDTTQFASEAEKTIKRLSQLLKKHNFELQEQSIENTPTLIAKYIQNKNLPTGLIYTNYDLELLEISPERKNNPFNLYLGKDEIIGRGVAENK
jgi:glutamate racemase